MQVDAELPMETVIAALKGHFDPGKTVEEVFEEMDQARTPPNKSLSFCHLSRRQSLTSLVWMRQDDSGYLDEEEVRAAIAMLGFAVDSANLARVMVRRASTYSLGTHFHTHHTHTHTHTCTLRTLFQGWWHHG